MTANPQEADDAFGCPPELWNHDLARLKSIGFKFAPVPTDWLQTEPKARKIALEHPAIPGERFVDDTPTDIVDYLCMRGATAIAIRKERAGKFITGHELSMLNCGMMLSTAVFCIADGRWWSLILAAGNLAVAYWSYTLAVKER